MKPTLIYIYGPPASGKLTVAARLKEATGFSLFHNHVTMDAITSVFEFGSQECDDVLNRLRLDVFRTAGASGRSLIFTNNSVWGGPSARSRFVEFAERARTAFEAGGGVVVFVQLSAPLAILEERVSNKSREVYVKLLDPVALRRRLEDADLSPLHPNDLVIDTSIHDAQTAAELIRARL